MAGFKKGTSVIERLMSSVGFGDDGCWNFNGWTVDGYGKIRVGNKRKSVHRLSYEFYYGSISDDICVLHKCDNRKCVNPEHLFLGTRADNNQDKVNKNRQAKGLNHGLKKEKHPLAKLTDKDVSDIRNSQGIAQYKLAEMYGVSQSNINKILNNNGWRI
jgi:DNA-binding transcriptional regulator YiaG